MTPDRPAPDPRLTLALRARRAGHVHPAALAEALGWTPEAVAQAVAALPAAGFVVEDHPHQGLRLTEVPEALREDELACDLGPRRVGRRVRCVELAASTNDVVWGVLGTEGSAADGLAVFAEHQTAGRGRRGNRWLAPPHQAILASVALAGQDGGRQAVGPELTRAAAVAAARAVEDVAGRDVGLRWPNDLVLNDRKLGGVLVEARPGLGAVVGIGLNVSQREAAFPAGLRRVVTSLAMVGEETDRTLLARALLMRLDAAVSEKMTSVSAEASSRCRTLGRRIRAIEAGREVAGEVVALDPDYALVVRTGEGVLTRLGAMTTHVLAPGVW